MVGKAFAMSGTEFALVDGDRPRFESVVEELGFEAVSETWLRETTGVPLDLVERVERELTPIDEGLRLGESAAGYDDEFVADELPAELLEAANGVDRAAVREAVDGLAVAYETAEGGSLVAGPVALAEGDDRRALVEALAAVLESKYDAVEVREGEVYAVREAFDPNLAREAGVEEGPAFGRLADGRSVEIDGETVDPGEVRSARERRFPF